MSSASEKTENAIVLPYKRYEDSITGVTQKSNLLAQIYYVLDINPESSERVTVWRYRKGKTRPRFTDRKAIAFVVNKVLRLNPKVTGDDLFPEDFPYTGANKKK